MATATKEPKEAPEESLSLQDALDKQKRQLEKGWKGQVGLKQSRIEELEGKLAAYESKEAQNKPPEAEKPHLVRPWQKECEECGEPNTSYRPPTVACETCGQFVSSSVEVADELKRTGKTDKLTGCKTCGTKGDAFQVRLVGNPEH